MTSYASVLLGEVVEILSGFAFKSSGFGTEGEIPIVRNRDVVRGYSKTFYTGEYDEQFLVKNGDLLISMDGEFHLAKWRGGPALLNQRVCKIAPSNGNLHEGFLGHFLPAELKRIEDKTPFATVKHLSAKKIKSIAISLPPVEEQRRIAAILDKADAIRRKREQALQIIDEAIQSTFIHKVGPRANDYGRWEETPLEALAKPYNGSMRTGPFGSDLRHSEFVDEGIAVLGIDNAVQNKFTWGERRYITDEKYQSLQRYTVHPDDVIVTIMGTTGRSAVVPDDIPLAITTKHLATISLDKSKAEPEFVSSALHRHPYILRQIAKENKGAIMAGLNLGIIKNLRIPIPPIEVQRDFAAELYRLRRIENKWKESSESTEELFASLSQRAFKGEL